MQWAGERGGGGTQPIRRFCIDDQLYFILLLGVFITVEILTHNYLEADQVFTFDRECSNGG
jgi:hypothetical protein